MKRFVSSFLLLFSFVMVGCTDNAPKPTSKEEVKEQLIQTMT